MEREEILRQCLEWRDELKKRNIKPDKRYFKIKRERDRFTRNNLENIAEPKYNVFDIAKQTLNSPEENFIFFIRERQICEVEGGELIWKYFGSLFDIIDGKVNYRTTTSFIPEEYLRPL